MAKIGKCWLLRKRRELNETIRECPKEKRESLNTHKAIWILLHSTNQPSNRNAVVRVWSEHKSDSRSPLELGCERGKDFESIGKRRDLNTHKAISIISNPSSLPICPCLDKHTYACSCRYKNTPVNHSLTKRHVALNA
jgi:hypothetical protein